MAYNILYTTDTGKVIGIGQNTDFNFTGGTGRAVGTLTESGVDIWLNQADQNYNYVVFDLETQELVLNLDGHKYVKEKELKTLLMNNLIKIDTDKYYHVSLANDIYCMIEDFNTNTEFKIPYHTRTYDNYFNETVNYAGYITKANKEDAIALLKRMACICSRYRQFKDEKTFAINSATTSEEVANVSLEGLCEMDATVINA